MSVVEKEKNNLAKEEKIVTALSKKLNKKVNIQRKKRLWVSIEPKEIVDACSIAYDMGFEHLSTISVTDWIEENNFEIAYHLWSYKEKMLLTIKARINRENPTISSVTSLWSKNAELCERECHEFYGVIFEGNVNLTPLMLEDWADPPPFRKDFDWRKYVQQKYYDESNPREDNYFEVKK